MISNWREKAEVALARGETLKAIAEAQAVDADKESAAERLYALVEYANTAALDTQIIDLLSAAIHSADGEDIPLKAAHWRAELCQHYLDLPDYEKACQALAPAVGALNTPDAYLLLSRLLVQINRVKDAIFSAAKGLELDHGNMELLVHLAEVYVATNQISALDQLKAHAAKHLGDDQRVTFHTAIEDQHQRMQAVTR